MTTTSLTSVDLTATALHINPGGGIHAAGRCTAPADSGAWHIATFDVETDADVHGDRWEMHPEADEAVCCLSGGFRIYFRPTAPDGTEDMVRVSAGTAGIVPRGRWHRIELDEPSTLMSVTLRHGTLFEKRSELG
ncbi:cupin [Streptomyces sp. MBT49]|uniref:cupin n=1 Tax=Streptomyces sp. MBT49 TaxID=1488380 RepID=UPI00190B7CF6|nr:cupin [Streptomyces sp. MBT49]MBK3628338.1 cupin [Streptomyces sp. MBT49]